MKYRTIIQATAPGFRDSVKIYNFESDSEKLAEEMAYEILEEKRRTSRSIRRRFRIIEIQKILFSIYC